MLIRPALQNNWSHSNLSDAVEKVLSFYLEQTSQEQKQQHNIEDLRQLKFLFLLDGYDELKDDIEPRPLWTQIGLQHWPNSKLIVTCRRGIVPKNEISTRFEVVSATDTTGIQLSSMMIDRYLLPFNLHQMFQFLPNFKQHCKSSYTSVMKIGFKN